MGKQITLILQLISVKNVNPGFVPGIWTHDLLNMSLLT